MDAFSHIRKTGIAGAESKISCKLYDTRELREETVNRLVQSGDFENGAENLTLCKAQKGKRRLYFSATRKKSAKASPSIREKKIKEAKERSQKGYYNKPEVFSKIAQRLIDLFAT